MMRQYAITSSVVYLLIDSNGRAGYALGQCNNVGFACADVVSIILVALSPGSHRTARLECERRFALHDKEVHASVRVLTGEVDGIKVLYSPLNVHVRSIERETG